MKRAALLAIDAVIECAPLFLFAGIAFVFATAFALLFGA